MVIKPILFNTAMVRAIRANEKTNTRRVIPPEKVAAVLTSPLGLGNPDIPDSRFVEILCSTKYEKGDVLWVRENWAVAADLPGVSEGGFVYMADYSTFEQVNLKRKRFRWRPSIHMSKEVAREFLLITDVRAEQLQDITDEQCMNEGIQRWSKDGKLYKYAPADGEGDYPMWPWQDTPITPRGAFVKLWDSTVPKSKLHQCGFAANPWVSVIEFERCQRPDGF